MRRPRATQIICTIGPASSCPETLRELARNGMDVARLNLSHGSPEEHRRTADTLRRWTRQEGLPVRLLLDLQGPKLRIGDLRETREVAEHDTVLLGQNGDARVIPVGKEVLDILEVGDVVFLRDGSIELRVEAPATEGWVARVVTGGSVQARAGLVVRGKDVPLPALTEKDREDLPLVRDIGPDWVAQSMVSSAADVEELQKALEIEVPVVAKIERVSALADLERIAERTFGLMVARGDLGVQLPRAEVPLWQKDVLALCRRRNRQGIVATEMLLSMVHRRRPTRAEVSDVATALFDGCHGVMLSEETAIGEHPVRALREMEEIVCTIESSRWYGATGWTRPR